MKKHPSNRIYRLFIYFFIFILLPFQATGGETKEKVIRPPAVAGTFYPGASTRLQKTITSFFAKIPRVEPEGKILAAIAPHAGYTYSGGIAAYTHQLLSTVEFETLIIIGHDTFRDAVAFVCPVDYFLTPFGKIPVDREMMSKMQAFHPGIKADRSLHAREHTIEVQLPFLQVLNKQCKIIPILFGTPTMENCRILADSILAAAGNKTVFVLASTDMSHYPPYDSACRVDNSTLEIIKTLNVDNLFIHLKKEDKQPSTPNLRTAMCARGGVGTAILCAKARGANRAQILHYANSGDVPAGNKDRVVGYCAVLFVNQQSSDKRNPNTH